MPPAAQAHTLPPPRALYLFIILHDAARADEMILATRRDNDFTLLRATQLISPPGRQHISFEISRFSARIGAT